MIATSLPVVIIAGLIGTAGADGSAVELRYHGSFVKASRDGMEAGDPVKRFDLYCLAMPQRDGARDLAFVVDEHGGGGWPWPARFGTVEADAKNRVAKNRLRLLHEHDGSQYVLPIPFPYFEFADRLAAGARWQAPRAAELPTPHDPAPWKYQVVSGARVAARDCWRVDVANNFGPQESVWIETNGPLIVSARRRIVIGRGDEYVLKMDLDSVTPVPAESLARLRRPLDSLLRLQEQLKRPEDEKNGELTGRQLTTIAAALKTLEPEAEGTPFEGLVADIARDLNTQSRRSGDVESLAKRFIGKAAPPIVLKSLDNETLTPDQRTGKIVLLHFWSYQGEPFPPEPYGQVGYLDFLHNRRQQRGLKVYGIAVDHRLADSTQTAAVVRSIRKLQAFMNLSYPLAVDDGTLLLKFGDPERVGAKLPLWVLIDPSGTIVEYKLGNYDIKADEGLSQLDKTVLSLLRKQRKSAAMK